MRTYARAAVIITLAAFALLAWLAWLDRPRTPVAMEKATPDAGKVVQFEQKRKTG